MGGSWYYRVSRSLKKGVLGARQIWRLASDEKHKGLISSKRNKLDY